MKTQAVKFPFAVALVAALLLSACGGGGGGSSSGSSAPAPSAVTSSNSMDVAANAFAAGGLIDSFASSGTLSTTSTSPAKTKVTSVKGILDKTLKQVSKVLAAQPGNESFRATATESQQYACTNGGTYTVTITMAQPNSGIWSNGDSLTITFNNCVEGTGIANGTYRVGFSNISGTPFSSSAWSATLQYNYTNYTFADGTFSGRVHGDITQAVNQASSIYITNTVSGTSFVLTVTDGGVTISNALTNFTYSGSFNNGEYTYSSDYSVSGTYPNLGTVSYVVKTNTPFKYTAGTYPYQGALTVTATNKSSLKLIVIDSANVQIQIDKDGDGTYEEIIATTWANLVSRL